MPDLFANDLFEIYGTHISISSINDFCLKDIEYIMRPAYIEYSYYRRIGFFRHVPDTRIEFDRMEYYAAIIGEEHYKNAIEEAKTHTLAGAVAKQAVLGVSDALSVLTRKPSTGRIRYRIMNAAGRISERRLDEIPAKLRREDGKESEVFSNDELYSRLGEPIAPSIVYVPALFINSRDGKYVFFGNGINIDDIDNEYERLKAAITLIKLNRTITGKSNEHSVPQNLIESVLKQIPPMPKITIPFLKEEKKDHKDESE